MRGSINVQLREPVLSVARTTSGSLQGADSSSVRTYEYVSAYAMLGHANAECLL